MDEKEEKSYQKMILTPKMFAEMKRLFEQHIEDQEELLAKLDEIIAKNLKERENKTK